MAVQDLVLIPGLGSDAAVWRRTVAALGDGPRCLVGDTLSDNTLAGMARRILDQAPASFALGGVSMGGMVALELMRIAPERVTHLALVDTNARPDTVPQKAFRHIANLAVAMTRDFGRLSERSIASLVHASAAPEIRRELAEMGLRVGPQAYMRQSRAVLARSDLRGGLGLIHIPISVIVGREDHVTPLWQSEEMHRLAPHSTLHVIPDCGHLPPIEKPTTLAALFRDLLAER